jgi:Domain of unknown function (DUF4345)
MGSAPQIVLILAGLGFIGFGAAYTFWPARMARLTDIGVPTATARADFVATYGGFQIGFGIFLLACARNHGWLAAGLWAVVAALDGFASGRAATTLLHRGQVRRSIWFGLGLELSGLALSLWGLGQLR